jgi:hypothetical protein
VAPGGKQCLLYGQNRSMAANIKHKCLSGQIKFITISTFQLTQAFPTFFQPSLNFLFKLTTTYFFTPSVLQTTAHVALAFLPILKYRLQLI